MDGDLGKKIEELLRSPDSMAKIGEAMAALGINADTPPPEPKSEPPFDLSALAGLAPLLSSMGQDDQHTALLRALRPYLHGDREKRLDESVKLMQLLKFLPLLREGGLFK